MLTILQIQRLLKGMGFDPGPVDGLRGPKTEAGMIAFNKAHGYPARPYLSPQAMIDLAGHGAQSPDLPWLNEISRHLGLHETRDFSRLYAWLKSDGATLGDPRKLPWCGDAIQTSIKLALRDEHLPPNPYLARNWLTFGVRVFDVLGAVGVFWRVNPKGTSGHVGFLIGHDPVKDKYRVRGGNQLNSVSDCWIEGHRLLGARWPSTYGGARPPLPVMDSKGAVISTNEA